jgi:UrcA family protein
MKLATALVTSMLSLTTLAAWGASRTDDGYSVTVKFGDLDLNQRAGIAELYVRITGAARRVCDRQAEEQLVMQTHPVCVKNAVSTAIARIDRPMLTDYVAQLGDNPAKTAPASVAAR